MCVKTPLVGAISTAMFTQYVGEQVRRERALACTCTWLSPSCSRIGDGEIGDITAAAMHHAVALYIKHGGFMHIRIVQQLTGRLLLWLLEQQANKRPGWHGVQQRQMCKGSTHFFVLKNHRKGGRNKNGEN